MNKTVRNPCTSGTYILMKKTDIKKEIRKIYSILVVTSGLEKK